MFSLNDCYSNCYKSCGFSLLLFLVALTLLLSGPMPAGGVVVVHFAFPGYTNLILFLLQLYIKNVDVTKIW